MNLSELVTIVVPCKNEERYIQPIDKLWEFGT
jgi:hypothetical protein